MTPEPHTDASARGDAENPGFSGALVRPYGVPAGMAVMAKPFVPGAVGEKARERLDG